MKMSIFRIVDIHNVSRIQPSSGRRRKPGAECMSWRGVIRFGPRSSVQIFHLNSTAEIPTAARKMLVVLFCKEKDRASLVVGKLSCKIFVENL